MRPTSEQSRQAISLDIEMSQLRDWFDTFADQRAANRSFSLTDVLLSGYAMFALKYPSLLAFETQTQQEAQNLHTLFGVQTLCSDAQLRRVLDQFKPSQLIPFWANTFQRLSKLGILKSYRWLDKYLIVSTDGVEHFHSTKVHCPHCLTKTHRDGTTAYTHSMLCSVLVHPQQAEVFVLATEPILTQDGATKNDCERAAAQRLLKTMQAHYARQRLLYVSDALYACASFINALKANQSDFIIAVKPDGHKALFAKWEARRKTGKLLQTHVERDAKGLLHRFEFFNQVSLNEANADCKVNFIHYQQVDKQGRTTTFSWVSSLPVSKRTVFRIMQAARSRWKIENETFNTLKNQGYHFEHNYGHGGQHLATVLAYLMLIAFTIDQLIQRCSHLFGQLWQAAKTKAKLWQTFRALFMVKPLQSFHDLYQQTALLLAVQVT